MLVRGVAGAGTVRPAHPECLTRIPQQLPAPEQQAVIDQLPVVRQPHRRRGVHVHERAGYAFTAVYQPTQPDGCLKVRTRDGIDGFVNPTVIAVVVRAAVSARAE